MQENELKTFVKENLSLIYEYINSEILKDIGVMSPDFFVRVVDEYFTKEEILPLIINISNRILKMVSSKRMLMFYEEQVLEELIKYIKVQQKMAKRYFK